MTKIQIPKLLQNDTFMHIFLQSSLRQKLAIELAIPCFFSKRRLQKPVT